MDSNKQKWTKRHEQGLTKFDIASEAQIRADAAKIANVAIKNSKKQRLLKVDAQAEAAIEGATKAEVKNKNDQAARDAQATNDQADATKTANETKAGK